MKEFIKDLIIAIIIVVAVMAIIKPTIVKEDSMEPTLYENHYLLVNKLAYKMKDHPGRGDIIVFRSDLDNYEDGGKKLLIKRVIGVEGDLITIEDGNVYRNGELLDEPYIKEQGRTVTEQGLELKSYEVGKDKVFCMGDNREVSLDSRSPAVGDVDEDAIMGKAFLRLFPVSKIGLLH